MDLLSLLSNQLLHRQELLAHELRLLLGARDLILLLKVLLLQALEGIGLLRTERFLRHEFSFNASDLLLFPGDCLLELLLDDLLFLEELLVFLLQDHDLFLQGLHRSDVRLGLLDASRFTALSLPRGSREIKSRNALLSIIYVGLPRLWRWHSLRRSLLLRH